MPEYNDERQNTETIKSHNNKVCVQVFFIPLLKTRLWRCDFSVSFLWLKIACQSAHDEAMKCERDLISILLDVPQAKKAKLITFAPKNVGFVWLQGSGNSMWIYRLMRASWDALKRAESCSLYGTNLLSLVSCDNADKKGWAENEIDKHGWEMSMFLAPSGLTCRTTRRNLLL